MGPQPYRNIRSHLTSIGNLTLANFFHSAELAIEREADTFFNRVLSHAYEKLSDYGSSAMLPVLWWFGIGLLSALSIYSVDGAINAFSVDSEYYIGWRESLLNSCPQRSLYLSFQSMLNPLGIFGVKVLFVPAYSWLAVMLLIQGLLSAVLIALTIFAIRRRFKINS